MPIKSTCNLSNRFQKPVNVVVVDMQMRCKTKGASPLADKNIPGSQLGNQV